MTGAVLDRPVARLGFASSTEVVVSPGERGTAARGLSAHGGATLEDLLTGVLHETRTNGSTECPVCHARMTLTRAHAECGGCGSRLS